MAKILVVDDDDGILTLVKNVLNRDNHLVYVKNSLENVDYEQFQGYDLILLDIMMPFMNGYDLCRDISGMVSCPILFLSAKTEENDKVKGFVAGADDYITKPFGVKELQARVKAHIRREKREKNLNRLYISGVLFDFDKKEVYVKDEKVPLTKYEYQICEILAANKSKTYTKENIYDLIYDLDANAQFRTITEFIYSIRKKFGKYNMDPIVTVWGVGYRWK